MKKMIQFSMVVFGMLMISASSFGQGFDQIDPNAKKVLDKVKAEYDTYTSMEATFDLVMELPGQDAENQAGKVIQSGEKFNVDIGERLLISDGTTLWHYIKKNNEVQINDADLGEDETNMLSPKAMLDLYESSDYIYGIVAEPVVDGQRLIQIEFKPIDRDSEFSKMSLLLVKGKTEMKQMKVFSKDGSRFTLKIKDITANKDYANAMFVFDESKYPEIYIEDLRID